MMLDCILFLLHEKLSCRRINDNNFSFQMLIQRKPRITSKRGKGKGKKRPPSAVERRQSILSEKMQADSGDSDGSSSSSPTPRRRKSLKVRREKFTVLCYRDLSRLSWLKVREPISTMLISSYKPEIHIPDPERNFGDRFPEICKILCHRVKSQRQIWHFVYKTL